MSKLFRLVAVLLVAGAAISPFLAGRADAATVPDAADCYQVKPLGLLDLFNLVDDLDDQSNSGSLLTTTVYGPSLSTGPAATAADKTAVTETLNSFVACVNAREPMRILNLLSQRYQASLVLAIVDGGDAYGVIADQVPVIARSNDVSDPVATPDTVKAWRPTSAPDQIWTIVSGEFPGYDGPQKLFISYAPADDGSWAIDLIASYTE